MAYDERSLRGVGGWLAFFVLTLAVFGPLRSVLNLVASLYGNPAVATAYGDRWPILQAVEWAIVATSVGTSWYLAWRLGARQVPSTPPVVMTGIWFVSLGLGIVDLLAVSLISGQPVGALLSVAGGGYVGGAVYAGVWTAYLAVSRRVANTYRPDETAAEVFE